MEVVTDFLKIILKGFEQSKALLTLFGFFLSAYITIHLFKKNNKLTKKKEIRQQQRSNIEDVNESLTKILSKSNLLTKTLRHEHYDLFNAETIYSEIKKEVLKVKDITEAHFKKLNTLDLGFYYLNRAEEVISYYSDCKRDGKTPNSKLMFDLREETNSLEIYITNLKHELETYRKQFN